MDSLRSGLTIWDWLIVAAYLAFTTWLGAYMSGKQQTIRDFFLGGRKLPWYAVSGSMIATEISALTFISVPTIVFGGNFTYLQLGLIGSVLARVIVGYYLVPEYYKREIYSPYDYMGEQLGGPTRRLTTVLFVLSAMLAQSARIYLTGEVAVVLLHDELRWLTANLGLDPLAWSILVVSAISVCWTLLGGMTSVIWTDVALFLCFVVGAFVALGTVAASLPGGLSQIIATGWNAKEFGPWGKFTFFDFSTDPTRDFTIWAAVIASTWGGLGSYGTDQLLVQRMFCCKSQRDARLAIISSSASMLVTIVVMFVGVGLYAYYIQVPQDGVHAGAHPKYPGLSGAAKVLFDKKADRIFPIFVAEVVPVGLKGVIVAAIAAAAISTVMGVLTALSQTVMTAFYTPMREAALRRRRVGNSNGDEVAEHRLNVQVGRWLIVFWGALLSVLAWFMHVPAKFYPSILQLGLAMAGYVSGALIAGYLLAFLRLGVDWRGFAFSAPLSTMCVFALAWHQPWSRDVLLVGASGLLVAWSCVLARGHRPLRAEIVPTILLLAGVALAFALNRYLYWPVLSEDGTPQLDQNGAAKISPLAWPWWAPIGSIIGLVWGYLLARPAPERRTETLQPT